MTARSSSIAYVWGTTAEERAMPFPCDRYLPDADDAYFRAVDIDAGIPGRSALLLLTPTDCRTCFS
ncbi:MAG: hypothetical protein ACLQAT_18175 [Candidatus Binataceae bacterium]